MLDRSFASDNAVGAHPAVLDAIAATNGGAHASYGADPRSDEALVALRRLLGPDIDAVLVATGTAANVIGLAHVLRPHESVICPATSHLVTDESTAPAMAGVHLLPVPTVDGKLRPADVEARLGVLGDVHAPQPRAVSIAQSNELGLVYSVDEVRALADVAHASGLLLHVDGARLGNAVAALDVSARVAVVDAGVDLLSLGLTKNGALAAEAIVGVRPGVLDGIGYGVKRGMQLLSKGRLLGAQVVALLQDDLWLANARHANALARRLGAGLAALPGVELARPVEANGVFVILPPAVEAALAARYAFLPWSPARREFRLMCSWTSDPDDVDALVAVAAAAC